MFSVLISNVVNIDKYFAHINKRSIGSSVIFEYKGVLKPKSSRTTVLQKFLHRALEVSTRIS